MAETQQKYLQHHICISYLLTGIQLGLFTCGRSSILSFGYHQHNLLAELEMACFEQASGISHQLRQDKDNYASMEEFCFDACAFMCLCLSEQTTLLAFGVTTTALICQL